MPIVVLCTKCRTRFQVSEKFAGKQGPCPKCKHLITVPKPEEEVKIHAPADFEAGGKDAKGRPVLKPIAKEDAKAEPLKIAVIAAAVVLAFAATFIVGRVFEPQGPPVLLIALGLAVVSPPLVYGGYNVLRDTELEPYSGKELLVRVAICSSVFALLWGGYWLLRTRIDEPILWAFYIAPFLIIGTLTALASLDLDPASAFFLYAYYLGVTILLRLTMGLPLLTDAVTTAT